MARREPESQVMDTRWRVKRTEVVEGSLVAIQEEIDVIFYWFYNVKERGIDVKKVPTGNVRYKVIPAKE